MKEGQVYVFAKGMIKVANKKFTSIPNDYSITFGLDADIKESNDTGSIKKEVAYQFVTIKEISEMAEIRTVDVIGVVLGLETAINIKL
jgi:replication factor A1